MVTVVMMMVVMMVAPRILTHVLSFIQCERAMVLLVHDGSQSTFSRVFELDQVNIYFLIAENEQLIFDIYTP